MDINSNIAKFLVKNENYSEESVMDSFKNLKNAAISSYVNTDRASENLIFDFSDDNSTQEITYDDFLGILSAGLNKDSSEIKDDAELLFNILDSDDENSVGKLTKEEMELFLDKNDKVSTFSIFNRLVGYGDEDLEEKLKSEKSGIIADNFFNGTMTLEDIKNQYENTDLYDSIIKSINRGYETAAKNDVKGSSSLSDSKINEIVDNINNGKRRLSDYKKLIGESLTKSDYEKIKNAVEKTNANTSTSSTPTSTSTSTGSVNGSGGVSNTSASNNSQQIYYDHITSYDSVDMSNISKLDDHISSDLSQRLDAKLGAGFSDKVEQVAQNLKCNPNALLAMMYSESGLTPDAKGYCGSTMYSGLFMFCETYFGDVSGMSAIDQLDLLEESIKSSKSWALGDANATLDDGTLYALNFTPAYAKNDVLVKDGDSNNYYQLNKGLDIDKNGDISKSDLAARLALKFNELNKYI